MKTILFALTFLLSLGSLHAQYVLRDDSLGFSVDFPAPYTRVEPQPLEQYGGQLSVHIFTCLAWETDLFMAAVNPVPAFTEDEQSIRTLLQQAVKELELPENAGERLKIKESITAHTGEIELECRLRGEGFQAARIFYRKGRLLQLIYYTPGAHKKKEWQRFSRSLKTDW